MPDYAIGAAFHKANRTIVRAVALPLPCRLFATKSADGYITLPTLDPGSRYVELQGVQNISLSASDNNQDFRLLGDEGWGDSVITGSTLQASVTAWFLKDTEIPAGQNCPVFRGDYEEGFTLIQQARYDKDYEIYIEILKELGRSNGATGNYIYDYTGFNCTLQNYSEKMSPEGLTEISFNLNSRGRPSFGKFDAGASPIRFGTVQSSQLSTSPNSGPRRYATDPADNDVAQPVADSLTVTYTSDGAAALTQLSLGEATGAGFRLEVASTGAAVQAAVTLVGNVVTVNPTADLAASTIYRLRVMDGAIMQAVDAAGVASPTGTKKALAGFTSTFRTV